VLRLTKYIDEYFTWTILFMLLLDFCFNFVLELIADLGTFV
jgi:hypothetical protein